MAKFDFSKMIENMQFLNKRIIFFSVLSKIRTQDLLHSIPVSYPLDHGSMLENWVKFVGFMSVVKK